LASIRDVLKGNVLILTLGTSLRALSLFITFPYFSLYVRALGGSNVAIGIVTALSPLAAMFVYPIAGALSESYSRVRILVVVGALNACLYIVYTLAPDWRFLAAASFINGLMVFTFPATSSLLADSMDPDLRGRGYAVLSAIPSFIGILTPFAGAYLIEVLGLIPAMRALYALTVAAITVITMLNWRFLEETRAKEPSPRSDLPRIVSGSYRSLLETMRWMPGNLKLFALMHVLAFLFNSLTGPYWVLYAADVQRISVIDWGSILTLSTLVQVVLTIPAGSLIDRYDTRKITALAAGLSALPILAFPFLRGFWSILISFILISVANAFLIPSANALMVELVPRERRGMAMAILGRGWLHTNIKEKIGGGPGMGFVLTLPVVVGSLVSGYIYDVFPSAPWLLLGSALMVNAVLAVFSLQTGEEGEEDSPIKNGQ
jgi:DHA1 family multidrug resistance protein-like MFS transporter